MNYRPGDRVRLTDASDFDTMRSDPFARLMDSREVYPSVGDVGTVDRLVGDRERVTQNAPDNGLYVRFDGLEGTWGILPDELELADQVAA